jgi:hypothetical protein
LQPLAIGGKWDARQNGSDKRMEFALDREAERRTIARIREQASSGKRKTQNPVRRYRDE